MQAGKWGSVTECRCGGQIQHFTPIGQGWSIRIDVQTGQRHRCPLNAPTFAPIVECPNCQQTVRNVGKPFDGPYLEVEAETLHVCRERPTPKPPAQRIPNKPKQQTKPRGVVIV